MDIYFFGCARDNIYSQFDSHKLIRAIMGGGGFMHDANRKMQQNPSLLERAKDRFGRKNISNSKSDINSDSYKSSTPDQLKKIREQVEVQRKAEQKRKIKLLVISFIGGIILAKILLIWMEA